jgi:putative redox protein
MTATRTPSTSAGSPTAVIAPITVTHDRDDRFEIEVRGHTIAIDQPLDAGGGDTAPAPTELFAAALGGCVAHYARRYLDRHGIASDGLRVEVTGTLGGKPHRFLDVDITVVPPPALPAERRDALLAVANGCTLHHTLDQPPTVRITFGS